MSNTVAENKKAMLGALRSALGITAVAAESSGIGVSVFRKYYQKFPHYKKSVDDIRELKSDFIESKLINQIKENNPTATIFAIKREEERKQAEKSKQKRCNSGDFKLGNEAWKLRESPGAKRKFDDPEILWGACCDYFQWVTSNPMLEEKIFHNSGKIVTAQVKKMRAMTVTGLCFFLDIDMATFYRYKKIGALCNIITRAELFMTTQKFEGAASDLLNANIISRDLGLADKQQIESRVIHTEIPSDATAEQAAQAYQRLMST